jgi:hypothetical protein
VRGIPWVAATTGQLVRLKTSVSIKMRGIPWVAPEERLCCVECVRSVDNIKVFISCLSCYVSSSEMYTYTERPKILVNGTRKHKKGDTKKLTIFVFKMVTILHTTL